MATDANSLLGKVTGGVQGTFLDCYLVLLILQLV